MEPVYDTPLSVNPDHLDSDINHNDPNSGEYLNATELVHSKLPEINGTAENEYTEITKTVTTVTKTEGGETKTLTVTKTVVTVTSDDVSNHDSDNISRRSDVIPEADYDVAAGATNAAVETYNVYQEVQGSEYEKVEDVLQEKLEEKLEERLKERLEERLEERHSAEPAHFSAVHVEIERKDEEGATYENVEGVAAVYVEQADRLGENEPMYATLEENATEIREEIREEIRDEIRENIREEIRDEIRNEIREEIRDEIRENIREEIRDEIRDEIKENIREEVREEIKESKTSNDEEEISKPVAAAFSSHNHVEVEIEQTKKTNQPSSSGKFVMRTISRADPQHVLQHITQNDSSHHNPEQDELVTYLKGENDAKELKQKMRSWIASPLIQQFNKESGAEQGQDFLPKNVAVTTTRTSTSGPSTREVRTANNPTSPPPTREVEVTTVKTVTVTHVSSEKPPVESPNHAQTLSVTVDPVVRNAEIAKAVEAAEFKPAVHSVQNGTSETKKETTTQTSTSTQGLSVYARQQSGKTEISNGVTSPTATNGTQTIVWKQEIERRKHSKDYVVPQKPNQPLKLAEVPDWKIALAEKNKQRKTSSADETKVTSPMNDNVANTEWQKEIRHILQQKSVTEGASLQDVPEWQKIADSSKK